MALHCCARTGGTSGTSAAHCVCERIVITRLIILTNGFATLFPHRSAPLSSTRCDPMSCTVWPLDSCVNYGACSTHTLAAAFLPAGGTAALVCLTHHHRGRRWPRLLQRLHHIKLHDAFRHCDEAFLDVVARLGRGLNELHA